MNELIHVRVWGDLACFTRPEMKVERVSYPVITPSAARGLLEAILYKPQFRWRVHRIAVRTPVRFLAFRRNEVKSKAAARNPQPILAEEDRTQRNTLALRDVDYAIEASIERTALADQARRKPLGEDEPPGDDNIGKYYGMARRRIENGQCFSQPCFGCREFPAHFEPAEQSAMQVSPGLNPDTDLGLMLYDVFDLDVLHTGGKVQARPQVTFFRAGLKNGVLVGKVPEVTDFAGVDWERFNALPSWATMRNQLGGAQ